MLRIQRTLKRKTNNYAELALLLQLRQKVFKKVIFGLSHIELQLCLKKEYFQDILDVTQQLNRTALEKRFSVRCKVTKILYVSISC